MKNIFQRHWHTVVRLQKPTEKNIITEDNKGGQLIAETIYCGTDCEVGARMLVDAVSFKIEDAAWETHTLPVTIKPIPELRGIEAYFDSGAKIAKVVAPFGTLAVDLFKEVVRGVIQSETFLLPERGYDSAAAYNEYWDKFYLNTCHYYSNLDRVTKQWDYSEYTRTSVLFNRFVNQAVYIVQEGGYFVIASFSDSYHEISVELSLTDELVITKAEGTLLRAPDEVCKEAVLFLKKLNGYAGIDPVKKQLAELLGLGCGCVHLIDTVYEALQAANIAKNMSTAPR